VRVRHAAVRTRDSRQRTNCSIRRVLTSAMMPRPKPATRPVTFSVACSSTSVSASPTALSEDTIVASTVPCPRCSRPPPRITTRCAPSSFSTNVTWLAYDITTAPTLSFIVPRYSSPSISWSWKPGMQGAIVSTSVSVAHASARGALTRNVLLISMRAQLLSDRRLEPALRDGVADDRRCQRRLRERDVEGGEGVRDRVDDRRGGGDRARLAHALDAAFGDRRRRLDVMHLDRGDLHRR